MREVLAALIARLVARTRWLARSRTVRGWALRTLIATLFSIVLTHFWSGVQNRVQPLVAHVRAHVSSVEPQIVCPSADHKSVPDDLSIHLPDRTTVQLNSDACLTVVFTPRVRRIRLDSGEAIFQVASDPRRPFLVETGPISVKALGTQFDIYRKKDITRVAVSEGAVQISSRDGKSRPDIKPLTILQQITVPDDVTQSRVRTTITSSDFERITAWRQGEILLQNQPLEEALEEFGRYQHLQVKFADPHIAQVPFSGAFHTNNIDDFLDLLKLKCINNRYNPITGQIELTTVPGKRAGNICQ